MVKPEYLLSIIQITILIGVATDLLDMAISKVLRLSFTAR